MSSTEATETNLEMILSGVEEFSSILCKRNETPRFLSLPKKPATEDQCRTEMFQQLAKLRDEEFLCDVNLLPGRAKVTIKAHRNILAACFEYFRVMFSSGMKESTQQDVSVPCVNKKDMQTMVSFAYSGKIDFTKENIFKMLILANYFGCESLMAQGIKFVMGYVDVWNCISLLKFALQYNIGCLRKSMILHIVENFKETFLTNPELSELPVDILMEIVGHPGCVCNTETVVEANERQLYIFLRSKISTLPKDQQAEHILRLLKAIHLPRVESSFLTYLENKEGHIPGVKELIKEAKKDVDPAETGEWYLERFVSCWVRVDQREKNIVVGGKKRKWYSPCVLVKGLPFFVYKNDERVCYVESPEAIEQLGLPYKVEVVTCDCDSNCECAFTNCYYNGYVQKKPARPRKGTSLQFGICVRFRKPKRKR